MRPINASSRAGTSVLGCHTGTAGETSFLRICPERKTCLEHLVVPEIPCEAPVPGPVLPQVLGTHLTTSAK